MSKTTADPLVPKVLAWWQSARSAWLREFELSRRFDAGTRGTAAELGLSVDDFVRLATKPGGRSELLGQRLAALGLTSDGVREVSSLVMRDLVRTCVCCCERERCAADMKLSGIAAGWDSYCPNSGTLRTLA